jgi:hypothetical protein
MREDMPETIWQSWHLGCPVPPQGTRPASAGASGRRSGRKKRRRRRVFRMYHVFVCPKYSAESEIKKVDIRFFSPSKNGRMELLSSGSPL